MQAIETRGKSKLLLRFVQKIFSAMLILWQKKTFVVKKKILYISTLELLCGPQLGRSQSIEFTADAWYIRPRCTRLSTDKDCLVHSYSQVSYGAASAYLSDKEKYPLFFRTIPPDKAQNQGRLAILKHFGWKKVAIITESESYYQAVSIPYKKLKSFSFSFPFLHFVLLQMLSVSLVFQTTRMKAKTTSNIP